jgi:N-6 DNA methylase
MPVAEDNAFRSQRLEGLDRRLHRPAVVVVTKDHDGLAARQPRRGRLPQSVVHNDMLGAAYEYLLRQFADEFFTPRVVVRLLIRILNPRPGESVYDPACGSGGMLVEHAPGIRAGPELAGQVVDLRAPFAMDSVIAAPQVNSGHISSFPGQ